MIINLAREYSRFKLNHLKHEVIIYIASSLLMIWFMFQMVRLAIFKYYTIDEFQYAHASWLVSKGNVPFRDFFDHHFPLIYQLLALPFCYLDNNPANTIYLRIIMILFVLIIVISIYIINAKSDYLSGIIAPLLLLAVATFSGRATEIRPDTVAFSLFIAAIALLYFIKKPASKGFLVGLLIIFSLWGSQKVFYYGLVFLIGFIIDVIWNRRHGNENYLLGKPSMVVLGSLTGLVPIFLYLTVTQSWSEWYFWCIKWAFIHQQEYQGFSWTQYFIPFLFDYWWLFPFAFIGIVYTIDNIIKKSNYPWGNPDLILLGALLTSFISYAIQTAPFSYSLIPFVAILATFSARGVAWAFRACWKWYAKKMTGALALYVALCIFILLSLINSNAKISNLIALDNSYQEEIFTKINDLTNQDDTIYDNSGGYVTRPHVYYFFYTDSLLRHKLKNYIAQQVPQALLKSRCVMVLQDIRFQGLPESLKKFIDNHFQPYNGDIRLWGQKYQIYPPQTLESEFYAIKNGKYFIQPLSALEEGDFYIDGKKITKPFFVLEEGHRKIRYIGKAKEFFILWLPKNNQPYYPRFNLPANFSKLL